MCHAFVILCCTLYTFITKKKTQPWYVFISFPVFCTENSRFTGSMLYVYQQYTSKWWRINVCNYTIRYTENVFLIKMRTCYFYFKQLDINTDMKIIITKTFVYYTIYLCISIYLPLRVLLIYDSYYNLDKLLDVCYIKTTSQFSLRNKTLNYNYTVLRILVALFKNIISSLKIINVANNKTRTNVVGQLLLSTKVKTGSDFW